MKIHFNKNCHKSYPGKFLLATKAKCNIHAKRCLRRIKNARIMVDSSGQTLLHHSVKWHNAKITKYLIEKRGCDVNVDDKFGVTPLSIAVQKSNIKIVDLLLRKNADIYLPDYTGVSPLLYAARKCILTYSHVAKDDRLIMAHLVERVERDFILDRERIIQLLLDECLTVKIAVVVLGSLQLAKCILEHDESIVNQHVDQYGHTALHCAIILSKVKDNAQMLIEHGANVNALNAAGHSPLFYYPSKFEKVDVNLEILKSLLTVDAGGCQPMSMELERLFSDGNKQTLRTILQSDIDIPVMFEHNRTLLFLLAINKHPDTIQVLDELSMKYEVNARDENGATPLFYAAYRGRANQVKYLLDCGADVNMNLYSGGSILEAAAKTVYFKATNEKHQTDTEQIVQMLLQHGAIVKKSLLYNFSYTLQPRDLCKKRLSTNVIVAHLAMLVQLDTWPLTDITRYEIMCSYLVNGNMSPYFQLCMQQIRGMKNVVVQGKATLFQLLTDSEQKIRTYVVRDRKRKTINAFLDAINNHLYTEKLAGRHIEMYYVGRLVLRIHRAIDMTLMDVLVSPIIEALTGFCSDVFQHIVRQIISNLGYRDLQNLLKIVKIEDDDDCAAMEE